MPHLLGENQSQWSAVWTHLHKECFATANLLRQGFSVYQPKVMKRIRHARREYDAARALFPGYLFVKMPVSSDAWRPLLGTYGVRKVLMSGEVPATLPQGFVESLKAYEIDGVIRVPAGAFQVGQYAQVQGGAFDGLIGQIIEMKENERVLLLLEILNRQTRVYVNAGSLSRYSGPEKAAQGRDRSA